ncbi:tol-pal system protein YbgF [Chachezhania sediminis]|uniref:tol-pal system protein YbgF n=1 Tax=Chachezhania sediminis TaxID=2599291 RepID=UPI00131D91E4|nr:tol-pal system protein YbgF [Chachezhania sediminis]
MRGTFKVVFLVAALCAGPALAQDRAQTLADIRQELTVLNTELKKLQRELSTTGPAAGISGTSIQGRVDAIETELTRLTSKTEELDHRIQQIVADGTNRLGDLEFRLVELEGGDLGQIGQTPTLGGGTSTPAPMVPVAPEPQGGGSGAALAVGEQADFDAAVEAATKGDYQDAADRFQRFNETYPGSPLAVEADMRRGQALEATGNTREAARAYLAAFTADPQGTQAPDALVNLGTALGQLGQRDQACITLGEVAARFPNAAAVSRAQAEMSRLQCQ